MDSLLPVLQPGDSVEIIAPASRCKDEQLAALLSLLRDWRLNPIVDETMFGPDLLCANDDKRRFASLHNALCRPKTKAIICVRGGYGSTRLLSALQTVSPPPAVKVFVGMSDITALHLFLQQRWGWASVHGSVLVDNLSLASLAHLKALLFRETDQFIFEGLALNAAAEKKVNLNTSAIGGNLSLVQASIGTPWQLNAVGKLLVLEEINERAYRVDRMLEHLKQAQLFKDVAAILFGDFLGGAEPDGSSLIAAVLKRFAEECSFPVFQIPGIGHGSTNFAFPLGTKINIELGQGVKMVCIL